MIICIEIRKIFATVLLTCVGMVSQSTLALPEDANQEIIIEGGSGGFNPDQGLYILNGDAEGLAHVKQGTMEIFGSEIRVEITDGVVTKATAIGSPARFQQQPKVDQAIVHLSGQTLDYDNSKRMLNIDGDAKFSQAGHTVDGPHMDYNLDTGDVNATASEGKRVQIVVPPRSPDQP